MKKFTGLDITQTRGDGGLPIEVSMAMPQRGLVLQVVTGLSVVALGFYLMRGETYVGGPPFVPLIAIALGVYFAGRAVPGLLRLRNVQLRVDLDGVHHTGRGKGWTEPLAAYSGVKWERFAIHERSGSKTSERRTRHVHLLTLSHPDPARTVPLYKKTTGRADLAQTLALVRDAFANADPTEAQKADMQTRAEALARQASADEVREVWEDLARTLDLPAIDARDGGEVIRAAEDVDKSVQQLAAEGKISAAWDDRPPPPQLEVLTAGGPQDPEGQRLEVTLHAPTMPIIIYIMGGIGALMLVAGLLTLTIGTVFGGLLFGGVAYGIHWIEKKNPRRIVITRTELAYQHPNVRAREFRLPLAEIETIGIRDIDSASAHGRTLKLSGRQLLVSSDSGEHRFGEGLREEALVWLQDYIRTAVATA